MIGHLTDRVTRRRRRRGGRGRVLILLENLPLQRDARVKRQCRALLDAGYGVTVICPRSDEPLPEELAAIRLLTWRSPPEGSGRLGFVREYAVALVMAATLTVKAWLEDGFDVIQSCNPPDIFFLVAAPFRLVGVPFVFDHHDLSPELFSARYDQRSGPLLAALQALERATFATSDHVIATNESIKGIAIDRGGKGAQDVTVVRNGPVLAQVRPREPDPGLRHGRQHLCCWHGVMGGADDGLDLALHAVAEVVHRHGRQDCHFAFLGDGELRPALHDMARELGVDRFVSFPGWVSTDVVYDHLATSTLGLAPDPKTAGVDKATVMKVMEYMAFEVPVVAFDVTETKVSAGEAGRYADGNDPAELARAIVELLDDPDRRTLMGREGRRRIDEGLAWDHQRAAYVQVFDRLLGEAGGGAATGCSTPGGGAQPCQPGDR